MNCGASALSTERGRVRSTAPGRYIAGNTFLFALVLLAAFVLRLWNLGTQSLWHDEAWSVFSAYHPLAWGQLGTDPNAPPIFYVTLSLWQHLAGDGVWAMRFWSLLIGVITVAITAHMTRRWYGERTALLAATFVAFCPILWVFSQEIRAYVAMPLLAIVLLALLDALVKPRPVIPRQWWAWVAVVELVALYTHNLSVPIVAWLNIAALAVWALRREWRRLAWWGVLQAGIAVAYLPWLLTQRPTGTLLNTPPALRPQLIWDIWQSYFTGIKTLVGADTALMTLTALMGIGGLVVIMSLISRLLVAGSDPPSISTSDREWTRNRRMTTVLILSQAVLIPLLSLIEILGAHIDFHPRYFIDSAPATLMVIAIGLTGIPMRRIRPALAFAAVGLAIALMLRMMTVTYSSPLYQHDDFRTIAEHYARLGPDDRVIIPYGWEPTLDYYGQKMGFKDKLIGIPLYSSGDQIRAGVVAALQQARNVELLTWYQLPADVRGAYACLLGSAGHLDGSLIVEGLKTDHYDSLSALSPVEYDHRPSDRLRMDALEYEPTAANPWGRDGLCVLTRWKLWQQSSENLRLSAILRNNQGWEIAKVDSDILNDRQMAVTYWREGDESEMFNFLPLSPALPCIDYTIALKLYGASKPNGVEPRVTPARSNGDDLWVVDHVREYSIGTLTRPMIAATPPPVTPADIPIAGGLYLHSKDLPGQSTLQQGQTLRASLGWSNLGGRDGISVVLQGDNWRDVSNFDWGCAQQPQVISWHQVRVPASATGKAVLKVSDGGDHEVVLAAYDISAVERTYIPPTSIAIPAKAAFSGVGTLIGLDVSKPDGLTLYWQADASAATAYKVFVHLLDSSGTIIAQDDSEPVGGARATTNWLPGEYITDFHKIDGVDWKRVASIRVGLYDPTTETRVLLEDGTDNVTLAVR